MAVLIAGMFQWPVHEAMAADFVEDQQGGSDSVDSTFDPFSDYSEFEEGSDEEADVNFFHNGRFFTLGILGGLEGYTDILSKVLKPGVSFGLFVSYFFDLRFAVQVTYTTGDHALSINDAATNSTATGRVSMQRLGFDVKYYLNTQNVTKGLAKVNPYVIGGLSNYYRTWVIDGSSAFKRDSAMGLQAGMGIEIPMMRNKMFFGAQGLYHYVAFPDEGSAFTTKNDDGTTRSLNIYPRGDVYTLMALIGINF